QLLHQGHVLRARHKLLCRGRGGAEPDGKHRGEPEHGARRHRLSLAAALVRRNATAAARERCQKSRAPKRAKSPEIPGSMRLAAMTSASAPAASPLTRLAT